MSSTLAIINVFHKIWDNNKEVSEQIRQFKDKLKTAYKTLGEDLDAGNLDWAVIIQRAEEARKKYDMIAEDFVLRNR